MLLKNLVLFVLLLLALLSLIIYKVFVSEQRVTWVQVVCGDTLCSFPAVLPVNWVYGQILSAGFLTLWRAFFCPWGVTLPDSDACGEDALYQSSKGLYERASSLCGVPPPPLRISLSRHHMMSGMSVSVLKSLSADLSDLLGTGLMVKDLNVRGNVAWDSTHRHPCRPSEPWDGEHTVSPASEHSGPVCMCVWMCELKSSTRGVTGAIWRCVPVQTNKPGIEDTKAVWRVGSTGGRSLL